MISVLSKLSALMLAALVISCNSNVDNKEPITSKEQPPDSLHPVTPETKNVYAVVDISPMDMSYFPVDYPKLKMENINLSTPSMRVIYSRPHLDRRKLFVDLLKYGEPWRLGANESTEIQFYRDVTIQGKSIKNGRYILYCIPQADKWTIVLNSNTDSWGLKQDTTRDIQKFEIPVTHHNPGLEYLTIVFEKSQDGANLIMAWDEEVAKLAIAL
jgi:hypothetical protein